MASVRELEAEEYLRENKILELMDNLTSQLLYHRPERPREFLINLLEKLKYARRADVDYPCLFDESNLDAIFGVLDPSGQGYITKEQFVGALKTLGVEETNVEDQPERMTLEVFKHEMRTRLKKSCATFKH
ncbi:EF-hand calcium-binding domain-containing protein 10 [Bombina bombina]|uniref:EF-hand calcium-binding domain-containing protein 10 n=1 Tax=Bombina bombina TaxID=8345 RepID=UPI00235A5C13|nr:EF-hand calcium-binding domain-containing protein 10 [Bombina bombina]